MTPLFPSSPNRRRALATVAAFAALGAHTAWAQAPAAFPTKPVVVYTAFAVGSGPDAVLRLVAHRLSQQWKQSVTVDNRPGGGGFIAIEAARRAYHDWWQALGWVREGLIAGGMLREVEVTAAMPKVRPWRTQQTTPSTQLWDAKRLKPL